MNSIQTSTSVIAASRQPQEKVLAVSRYFAAKADSTGDLPNLDFLRAFAVGLVCIGHLLATMNIRGFGGIGHLGVLFFFVHTALVLMLSMDRMGLSGRQLYLSFTVRRLFRIYPLSILTVVLVVALHVPSSSWFGDYTWNGWGDLTSNILLIQNLTHSSPIVCVLWSLPFELQMYAILPILFLSIRRFRSFQFTMYLWLATIAIAGIEYIASAGDLGTQFGITRYFPCFMAGVVAWQRIKRGNGRVPWGFWILLLAALTATYRVADAVRSYGPALHQAMQGQLRNDHGFWWPPYCDLFNDWAFCAVTGLTIPLFATITWNWLSIVSKSIAKYSYGIYLSHVPIFWFCFKKLATGSLALSALFSLLLIGVVSVALYNLIEYPAIRWGKVLAARLVRPNLLHNSLPI